MFSLQNFSWETADKPEEVSAQSQGGSPGNTSKDTGHPKAKRSQWPNLGLCEHQSRERETTISHSSNGAGFSPAHEPKEEGTYQTKSQTWDRVA